MLEFIWIVRTEDGESYYFTSKEKAKAYIKLSIEHFLSVYPYLEEDEVRSWHSLTSEKVDTHG